jgi:hypothetical protein
MSETTDLLGSLNAPVLKALARKLGASSSITRHEDLVATLDHLIQTDVRRIVDCLPDAERKLAAEAAYNDGEIDSLRFAAKYGIPCPLPSTRVHPPSNASPLLLLIGGEYGTRRMPGSVANSLRAILEKPPAARIATVETLPSVYQDRPVQVFEGERAVFAELRSVLRLVQAGKVRLTGKGGRPTGESVRLIAQSMVTPDFALEPPPEFTNSFTEQAGAVRAHAWGVLVQQCGWSKARGGKLNLTDVGRKLLAADGAKEFAEGVGRLRSDDGFDEFNRINHIRGQSGRGKRYMTPPGGRRDLICDSISEWPVGQWIELKEAARFAEAIGKGFDVTEEDDTLYLGEFQYGMLSDESPGINRQYLRAVLFESLATLGLIDVAYVYPHDLWPELRDSWDIDDLSFCSRYDGLLYARLNALGAYCLGVTDSYSSAPVTVGGTLRVLANREIALVDNREFSVADRHVMEMFAAPRSDHLWALDSTRILTHVESGGSIGDLRQFLATNSNDPIPETVEAMLADLEVKANAVAGAQEAVLIEFRDETTAALIAHDTQARKYCYLTGNKRVAVLKNNLRGFRSALLKLGFVIPNDRLPH